MQETNYIVVQGWMRTKLDLKGNDLLVYALIYGFSQAENQCFSGSLQYIADWCGATKQGVQKNLKNLLDKGLIEKKEIERNNIKFCEYRCKLSCMVYNSVVQGMQLSCTNNLDNTQKDINNNSKELLLGAAGQFNFGAKKERKLSLYEKCLDMINEQTDDEKVRGALKQFLDMVLEISRDKGKPLYANVFKSKLKMLDDIDKSQWLDVINQSLQRGWVGFYYHENTRDGLQYNTQQRSMTEQDYDDLKTETEARRRRGYRTEF